MIQHKVIKMIVMLISGFLLNPLVAYSQLYTTELTIEEIPYISTINAECLDDTVRITVIPENPALSLEYTILNAIPPFPGLPITNTTGIFLVPNLNTFQSVLIVTDYLNCMDIQSGSFICNSGLPLQILNVYANVIDEDIAEIVWEVTEERNIKQYHVEKSRDVYSFESIGILPASNSNLPNVYYRFLDHNLYIGINYYRIRSEDAEGTFSYSKVVTVINNDQNNDNLIVYPNPTSGKLFVEHFYISTKSLDVSILSGIYDVIRHYTVNDETVPSILELSTDDLSPGMYILKLSDKNGNEKIAKFFKIN